MFVNELHCGLQTGSDSAVQHVWRPAGDAAWETGVDEDRDGAATHTAAKPKRKSGLPNRAQRKELDSKSEQHKEQAAVDLFLLQ